MSFFDFFGGMPHGHHMGGDDSDDEPIDTNKYYEILGVAKDAEQSKIKKAYFKKSKQLHPDRHPNEQEKYRELFQELQQVYDVLGDPHKRKIYDQYGAKAAQRGGSSRRGGGGMNDVISQMFGDRGGHQPDGPKKSPPIKKICEVTLEDLYVGATKDIEITRNTAKSGTKACPKCDGKGVVLTTQVMGPVMFQRRSECPACDGMGYKLKSETTSIKFHVPIGGRHGEQVTVTGEGHRYPDHAPGDIVVQLRQQKHEVFTRQGADLGMNHTLSLREAMCGYTIRINHVSGHILVISNKDEKEVVQPGSLRQVYTYGMPQRFSPHVKGHLYIVMEVQLPLANQLPISTVNKLKEILPNQDLESKDEEEEKDKSTSSSTSTKKGKKRNKRNKKKGKKKRKSSDEEIVEIVEAHEVEIEDGKLKATPAAARGSAYDEDDDDRDGMQCHHM